MYQLLRTGTSDNWSVNRESCFVYSGNSRQVEDWLDAQENAQENAPSSIASNGLFNSLVAKWLRLVSSGWRQRMRRISPETIIPQSKIAAQ